MLFRCRMLCMGAGGALLSPLSSLESTFSGEMRHFQPGSFLLFHDNPGKSYIAREGERRGGIGKGGGGRLRDTSGEARVGYLHARAPACRSASPPPLPSIDPSFPPKFDIGHVCPSIWILTTPSTETVALNCAKMWIT